MYCLLHSFKYLLGISKARNTKKGKEASIAASVRAALTEILKHENGRTGHDEKVAEAGARHRYEFDVWVTKCRRHTHVAYFVGDSYIVDDNNFFDLVAKAFDAIQAFEGHQVTFSFRQPRTGGRGGAYEAPSSEIVPVPEGETWGWVRAGGASCVTNELS